MAEQFEDLLKHSPEPETKEADQTHKNRTQSREPAQSQLDKLVERFKK